VEKIFLRVRSKIHASSYDVCIVCICVSCVSRSAREIEKIKNEGGIYELELARSLERLHATHAVRDYVITDYDYYIMICVCDVGFLGFLFLPRSPLQP